MSLPVKQKLPDLYLGEMQEYVRLQNKFNRTTTGQYSFTSSSSGIFYTTLGQGVYDNGGENAMGLLLYNNVLKNYIFDSDTYNLIRTTVGDIETDVSDLQTDLSTTQTDLNMARTAKVTTGTATAYLVDTDGTFDLTRNGNILTIIPHTTNTGSATINPDSQTAIGIRKANDAGTLVALEAGDIKINVPTQLVRDTVNNFFVYAPRGGSNIKSIQSGETSMDATSKNITITNVNTNNSIVVVSYKDSTTNSGANLLHVSAEITTNTNVNLKIKVANASVLVRWQVIEFTSVKSLQKGELVMASNTGGTSIDVSISSVNTLKCFTVLSFIANNISDTVANNYAHALFHKLTTTTNLNIQRGNAFPAFLARWQVIEFN